MVDLADLPGAMLVRRGVDDLAERRLSVEALTVAIASERLRQLGIELAPAVLPPDRELALYEALLAGEGDAYARYNSLRRELDSFLEALEARRRRAQRDSAAPSDRA